MLELNKVNVHYGVIHALKDVSLTVNQGEIVTLIGANGAGKSSTLGTISGLVKPSGGTVTLNGSDLKKIPSQNRVGMGVSQVPEGRRIFPRMSVLENLELGAFLRKDKAGIREDMEHVYQRFPILSNRKKQMAGTLSGGEQQRLTIIQGLQLERSFCLLDEVTSSLDQESLQAVVRYFAQDTARTVLAVTHNRQWLDFGFAEIALESGKLRRLP